MKKILSIIAMLVAMIPFIGVKAVATPTSYEVYKTGDIVNFYRNQNEKDSGNEAAGTETIILSDAGKDSKYVKAFMISAPTGESGSGTGTYYPGGLYQDESDTKIIGSRYWTKMVEPLALQYDTNALAAITDKTSEYAINYISVDEIKALTTVDASNNIQDKELSLADGTKTTLFAMFTRVAYDEDGDPVGSGAGLNGFYTSTIEGNQVWVVRFTITGNKVTGAKLQKVGTTGNSTPYAVVPVAYFDKTFDCHYAAPACYVCGTEYKWIKQGTQDKTCKLVPNATSVEDCVPQACYICEEEGGKSKYIWTKEGTQGSKCKKQENITTAANCIPNPKTGIESHILEFAIVAALCAIALLVVKRKDLFRTI